MMSTAPEISIVIPTFNSRVVLERALGAIFVAPTRRAVEVLGRRLPQILLIHASELNRDAMPVLLDMFRKSGYTFVSLEEALKDPAYKEPDDYAGPKGFSWIHRWALTKGMPLKMEPDEPKAVLREYERAHGSNR